MKKALTLCLITKGDQILLGMKQVGFGAGRWNGFGGKVEKGESTENAARRECKEEAGIWPHDLQPRGILEFEFEDGTSSLVVHVFSTSDFEGVPQESEEMKPQWFALDAVPYGAMWPDDQYWLPLLLAGKNFYDHFHFKDQNTLVRHWIEER